MYFSTYPLTLNCDGKSLQLGTWEAVIIKNNEEIDCEIMAHTNGPSRWLTIY